LVAVDALVVLVNNAAIENAIDSDAGVFSGGAEVEGVPIADPEVEFVIRETRTRRRRNCFGAERSPREQDFSYDGENQQRE
jgi:hypothetical protein